MKISKIIAGIMAVCIMGMACPSLSNIFNVTRITACASSDYTVGTYEQLTYKNYGDYIEISGCDESAETVVIPSEIDGLSVTSIGENAFSCCTSLTSVKIPDSVTSIGVLAFGYCLSLTSINVSENNTYYSSKNGVLFNKDKTELIQYPHGKTETEYIIPKSVTSIGECAFSACISLTSIEIPESVTNIGWSAFSDCSGLTSITIPDSVTSIGRAIFSN